MQKRWSDNVGGGVAMKRWSEHAESVGSPIVLPTSRLAGKLKEATHSGRDSSFVGVTMLEVV